MGAEISKIRGTDDQNSVVHWATNNCDMLNVQQIIRIVRGIGGEEHVPPNKMI